MKPTVAIIGGTGIGERLSAFPGRPVHVPTERGMMRGRIAEVEGLNLVLLQRHSFGHKTPPHMVKFEAMALGLRALGVKWCLSSAAVGSLSPDLPVGALAACTDIIDVSARQTTLFQRGVKHVDMGRVFPASGALIAAGGDDVAKQAVYVNVNGPRYESPAEIRMFREAGGDVVGMTAGSEAVAMREAGIGYGCLAIVTNMAAGLSPGELAHGDVTNVMRSQGAQALVILRGAAKILASQ
jgi:5'-methylthioadenosine phosphorylase